MKYFLFLIPCLLILSCEKKEDDSKLIKIAIDNTNIETLTDVSDKIDGIEIISLKETPGNYLGDIFKLYSTNREYVVFDRIQTRKINIFDKQGLFIKTAIKPGSGPNEALQLNDCWLTSNGQLEAYDFALKKIYQFDTLYNVKNIITGNKKYIFKSIKRIPNSDRYVGYATFDEYNPLSGGNPFHIAILDSSLNVINTDLPFDKFFQGIEWVSLREHFFSYGDSLRFTESLDNYVYGVTEKGINKIYKLEYQKNSLSQSEVERIVRKNITIFKNRVGSPNEKTALFKDFTVFNGIWLENQDYVYFTSREKNEFLFFTLYNKKTKSVDFNSKKLKESKRYNLDIPIFQYFDSEDNSFVGISNGADLKKSLAANSIFNSVVEEDVTVFYLVKVKFKK